MKIKDSTVEVAGIRPEMIIALMIAKEVYDDEGEELIITSALDGKHSETSLHYSGCALDIRTRYFSKEQAERVRKEIAANLGIDYDVILENDHMHIEFQPKKR